MADTTTTAAPVTVHREDCGPFWQVGAWPGTLGAVSDRLRSATGIDAPGPGEIVAGGGGQVARIAPLVWWIVGAGDDAVRALADMPVEEGAILDLTDNRVRFVVSGPRARDMMMRLAPLDFRDRAFPPGRIASTAAHHMGITVARRGEAWDLYVTSTFADALAEVLEETAAQWTR